MRSERSPIDLRNAETSVMSPDRIQAIHTEQRGYVAVIDVEHGRRHVGLVFNAPGVELLQGSQGLGGA